MTRVVSCVVLIRQLKLVNTCSVIYGNRRGLEVPPSFLKVVILRPLRLMLPVTFNLIFYMLVIVNVPFLSRVTSFWLDILKTERMENPKREAIFLVK